MAVMLWGSALPLSFGINSLSTFPISDMDFASVFL